MRVKMSKAHRHPEIKTMWPFKDAAHPRVEEQSSKKDKSLENASIPTEGQYLS